MGLTTTQSDGLYQQILDSYPFHPAWRDPAEGGYR